MIDIEVRFLTLSDNGEFFKIDNVRFTLDNLIIPPLVGDMISLSDLAPVGVMRMFSMAHRYYKGYDLMALVDNWMTKGYQLIEVKNRVIQANQITLICSPVEPEYYE